MESIDIGPFGSLARLAFLEDDLITHAFDAIAELALLDGRVVVTRDGRPACANPQLLGCGDVHAAVGKVAVYVMERPFAHALGPSGAFLVHQQQQSFST